MGGFHGLKVGPTEWQHMPRGGRRLVPVGVKRYKWKEVIAYFVKGVNNPAIDCDHELMERDIQHTQPHSCH